VSRIDRMSTGQLRTGLRYVHPLGSGVDNPSVLGGKGASLARMHALGLPTPPGFTIGTDGWRAYRQADERMPDMIRAELAESIAGLETAL
jgi:pyruvate,orthophosphate dikinase